MSQSLIWSKMSWSKLSKSKMFWTDTSRAKLPPSTKSLEPNALMVQFVLGRDAPVQKVTVQNITGPNCPRPNRDKPMCPMVPNVRSPKVIARQRRRQRRRRPLKEAKPARAAAAQLGLETLTFSKYYSICLDICLTSPSLYHSKDRLIMRQL